MAFDTLFAASSISSSGMSAERLRMELIANNIANAQTTRTPGGGPFRRQDVIFESVMNEHTGGASKPGGVRAVEIIEDQSEPQTVYHPGHPDADSKGYLQLPNVQLPIEMVNLLTASRAYEANVKTAQTFKQMSEQALTLLRG